MPARRGRGDSVATDVSSRSVPRAELRSRAIVARLGVALVTAAYVGYLALLVTCDLLQVAPLGFIPVFEPGRVIVGQLQPDSIVARAGLRAGDQLTRANGRVLEASGDWQRVRVDFDPASVIYAAWGGSAGGAQARGRHVDGPAPYPCADCGGGFPEVQPT